MEDKFLSIQQVSKILNVTVMHVQNLINSNKLSAYRFGNVRAVRIKQTDLRIYIRRCRIMPDRINELASSFKVKLFDLVSQEGVSLKDAEEKLSAQDNDGFLAYQYQNGSNINAGKQLNEIVSQKMKADSSLDFTKAFCMACDENVVLSIIHSQELRP